MPPSTTPSLNLMPQSTWTRPPCWTFKVPEPPDELPSKMLAATTVPLETVITPEPLPPVRVPSLPMQIMPLVTVSCPPVTMTAPVQLAAQATMRLELMSVVPLETLRVLLSSSGWLHWKLPPLVVTTLSALNELEPRATRLPPLMTTLAEWAALVTMRLAPLVTKSTPWLPTWSVPNTWRGVAVPVLVSHSVLMAVAVPATVKFQRVSEPG